jgi:hypothetical protein
MEGSMETEPPYYTTKRSAAGCRSRARGLGLYKSSRGYGLGWWLPGKFDWDKWRFKSDVGDRIIANNHIIQRDYGR